MISDVLHQALLDIEYYQNEIPQAYDGYRPPIEATKNAMRKLLALLDTPPVPVPPLVGEAPF